MDRSLFVPGKKVVIETRLGPVAHKAQSRIIGVREPDFVLVDMPATGEFPFLIEHDERCFVHILDEGRIVGVPARLHFALQEPFAIGILQYTGKTMHERGVRKRDRVDCNLCATVKPRSAASLATGRAAPARDGFQFLGALSDLSASGCQIAIPLVGPSGEFLTPLGNTEEVCESDRASYSMENLTPLFVRGKSVDLAFEMPKPEAGRYSNTPCRTRWTRPSGSVLLAGLRFDKPPEAFRSAVSRLVEFQRRFYTRPVPSGSDSD